MAFCNQCGTEMEDDAIFCSECGQKMIPDEPKRMPERKIGFAGEIHKCPHCGQTLESFESRCPTCMAELRGIKSSSAISELAEKLERTNLDKQRIVIIKNFPIPNTKEDIFEFMLLASSNFDPLYYVTHRHEEDISDAWLIKIEQCYSKAKLILGNDADFEKISDMYRRIKEQCTEEERRIGFEEKSKQEEQKRMESAAIFKRSRLRIASIVFLVVSAVLSVAAFCTDKMLAGVIALGMFALFAVTYLMGIGIVPEKVKNMRVITFVLALVLMIPYSATYDAGINLRKTETIEWAKFAMGDKLPDIGKTEAKVVTNSEDDLVLYFYETTKAESLDYIEKCKSFGYNIDAENSDATYAAYNSEGYYLSIWSSSNEVNICLKRPKEKNVIVWPQTSLVKDIPVPDHLIGETITESETTYSVYLVGVERSYFDTFVALCMEAGFTENYSKEKNSFRGEASRIRSTRSIKVEYEGFNTIFISIEKK